MKTIIIASDFSIEAKNATLYAIQVAKRINAKLVLFHLHQVSIHSVNARLSYAAVQDSINNRKMQIEQQLMALSKTHKINLLLDFAMGNFYEQLKQSVKLHRAGLVVMGMHDKSFEDDLLGSTTTVALHKLRVPVLAVPLKAKFQGLKSILFACDIKKGVTFSVLERIKEVARLFSARLEVFYVEDSVADIQARDKKIKALSNDLEGVTYMFKRVKSDAIINTIKNEIKSVQPNLLIMVPYEYGFWSSIVHKSKTRVMASGMNIPLLSIRG